MSGGLGLLAVRTVSHQRGCVGDLGCVAGGAVSSTAAGQNVQQLPGERIGAAPVVLGDRVVRSEMDRPGRTPVRPRHAVSPPAGKLGRYAGGARLFTLRRLAVVQPITDAAEHRLTVLVPAHLLRHNQLSRDGQVQPSILGVGRYGHHGTVGEPRLCFAVVIPEVCHERTRIRLVHPEIAADELQRLPLRPLTRVRQRIQRVGEAISRQWVLFVAGSLPRTHAQRNPEYPVGVRQPQQRLPLGEQLQVREGAVDDPAQRGTSGQLQPLTEHLDRSRSGVRLDAERGTGPLDRSVEMRLSAVADQSVDLDLPVPAEE